ncbi:MAG: hypothetical protein JW864_11665 [Spirochaetes bacterium]|nr:hypothetical protein [Spirochaetota bacterium]
MEDIVKMIIETEKIYSKKVHIVSEKYKTEIKSIHNRLEEEKNKTIKKILYENELKKESNLKEAKIQIDMELNSIRENKDKLLSNKNLCDKIKENIILTVF